MDPEGQGFWSLCLRAMRIQFLESDMLQNANRETKNSQI